MDQEKIKELHCLIVDDHAMMRKLVKDSLMVLGVRHIEYAADGKVAYEKLASKFQLKQPPFNVVILDWGLPIEDGYSVLQRCRSLKEYDNTAFIMLTAEAEKGNVIKAIRTGATSYITKPFTEQEFSQKFLKVVEWLQERNA